MQFHRIGVQKDEQKMNEKRKRKEKRTRKKTEVPNLCVIYQVLIMSVFVSKFTSVSRKISAS